MKRMKQIKKAVMFSVTAAVLTSCIFSIGGVYAQATKTDNNYAEKIMSLPIGEGKGILKYTETREDMLKLGPKSLAVDANGTVYILDTIDQQIEIFDKQGTPQKTIELPEDKTFFDLELGTGNVIYILDDRGNVLGYRDGILFDEKKYPLEQEGRFNFVGLFQNRNHDVSFRKLDGTEIDISTNSKSKGYTGLQGRKIGSNVQFTSESQTFSIQYDYQAGSTQPMQNVNGEEFVLENEILAGSGMYVETRVESFKGNKQNSAYLALPTTYYDVQVPFKFIYVSENGKVYQMVLAKNSVDIYELLPSKVRRSHIKEQAATIKPADIAGKHGLQQTKNGGTVIPFQTGLYDRNGAYYRAQNSALLSWNYTRSERTYSSGGITVPDHLNYDPGAGGTYETGIPYNWGGWDGVGAENYPDFATRVAGRHAGNIGSTVDTSNYAGQDCSGLISVAYNTSIKYGTSTLPSPSSPFKTITWPYILPGDFANKAGVHVWMWDSVSEDYLGNWQYVSTWEATTDGYGDKAKSFSRTWSDASTYQPMSLK